MNTFNTNFKRVYKRAIVLPAAFFALSIILMILLPTANLIFPSFAASNSDIVNAGKRGDRVIVATFPKLYYSNFNFYNGNKANGAYYYSLDEDSCVFVLVSEANTNNHAQVLENYTTTAGIERKDFAFNMFLEQFAEDIDWTAAGIKNITAPVYLDEVTSPLAALYIFVIATLLMFVISLVITISDIIYLFNPYLAPGVKMLKRFGFDKDDYEEIFAELEEDGTYTFGSIYVTKHFIFDFGHVSLDIIPIANISMIHQYVVTRFFVESKVRKFNVAILTMPTHRFVLHGKSLNDSTDLIAYINTHYPSIVTNL